MKSYSKAVRIMKFDRRLESCLPETFALLSVSKLAIHPCVSSIVLHGSRGLGGGFRPDSDIDLSLIVDLPQEQDADPLLAEVTQTSLDLWQGTIELDLAVIFDLNKCGLGCFEQAAWNPDLCQAGGVDCFGLYKTQKGFHGRVANAGIQVRRMYPCLRIWQRGSSSNATER